MLQQHEDLYPAPFCTGQNVLMQGLDVQFVAKLTLCCHEVNFTGLSVFPWTFLSTLSQNIQSGGKSGDVYMSLPSKDEYLQGE